MTARSKRLLKQRVEAWKQAGLYPHAATTDSQRRTAHPTIKLEQSGPNQAPAAEAASVKSQEGASASYGGFRAGQVWCTEHGKADFRVDSADGSQVLITWLEEGRCGTTHELAAGDLLTYVQANGLKVSQVPGA